MRTASTDSRTRQKLLDAAQALMLARGYTATSVDDICVSAGLTKGSFFHYFENKEDLGKAVAQQFFDSMQQLLRSAPFQQMQDPLDRVFGRVDFYINLMRNPDASRGCLLGTLVQELSDTHPRIRSVCASCFEQSVQSFANDLEEAQGRCASRAPWNARSVAQHMMAVIQGAIILAKAQQDRSIMAESLMHYREYLKLLLGK